MKSSRGSKTVGSGSWWSLGLPLVFFLCLVFFLSGFFGSALFFQQDERSARSRLRSGRLLEAVDDEVPERSFYPMSHGKSGEASLTSIPFQILSWSPRALYFPNFATVEQCQSVVKMAKAELRPSTLALRKGETAENTKGIRTSSGMFISASEDKSGVLDLIEEKIARATMIPRSHGEVNCKILSVMQGCNNVSGI